MDDAKVSRRKRREVNGGGVVMKELSRGEEGNVWRLEVEV